MITKPTDKNSMYKIMCVGFDKKCQQISNLFSYYIAMKTNAATDRKIFILCKSYSVHTYHKTNINTLGRKPN